MGPHGEEVARFIKPGQTIHIFADGCLVVHLRYDTEPPSGMTYPMMEDKNNKGHTLPEYKDSPRIRHDMLINSGYKEEPPDFWF